MSKNTAVIFDIIYPMPNGSRGTIDSPSTFFESGSVAIREYDTVSRVDEGTVIVRTPHGSWHSVVGSYESVLADFNRAANEPGTTAHIMSQDMVPHIERMVAGLNNQFRKEAEANLEVLKQSSKAWRSSLTK